MKNKKNLNRFNLKLKIVKSILVNGKKSSNEKKVKNIIKNLIKNNKKNSIFLLQLIVNLVFLVFRPDNNINFFPYFLTDNSRISFALKQVLKYYLLNKNIKFTSLEFTEISDKFTNLKKKIQFYTTVDTKLIHFYRW